MLVLQTKRTVLQLDGGNIKGHSVTVGQVFHKCCETQPKFHVVKEVSPESQPEATIPSLWNPQIPHLHLQVSSFLNGDSISYSQEHCKHWERENRKPTVQGPVCHPYNNGRHCHQSLSRYQLFKAFSNLLWYLIHNNPMQQVRKILISLFDK